MAEQRGQTSGNENKHNYGSSLFERGLLHPGVTLAHATLACDRTREWVKYCAVVLNILLRWDARGEREGRDKTINLLDEVLDLFFIYVIHRPDFTTTEDDLACLATSSALAVVSSVGIFVPVSRLANRLRLNERQLYSRFYTANVMQASYLKNKYEVISRWYSWV